MMPPPRRRLLMTGMFDMANYGDLLYPLVAAHCLAPYGIEVVPVAPTGRTPLLSDAMTPLPLDALFDAAQPADGILIGGGYIIHTHPLRLIESYDPGPAGDLASVGLWLGAAVAAVRRGVPLLWNAPGVPHPLRASYRSLAHAAFCASDYMNVRDRGAAALLGDDIAAAIVPDSIALLSEVFPLASLAGPFDDFRRRHGLGDAPYLALHLRHRSVAGLDRAAIAREIDAVAQAAGLAIVLTCVGQSHDDAGLAREMAGLFPRPPVVYDTPASLREMTAVLAHATLYVGASLHGYVGATAYGVPGVMVGRPAYHKFGGFLRHTGRPGDLATDWSHAAVLAREALAAPVRPQLPEAVAGAIALHFDTIAQAVHHPRLKEAERRALLSEPVLGDPALWPPAWSGQPWETAVPAGAPA